MKFISDEDRYITMSQIDAFKEPSAWLLALDRRIAALLRLREAYCEVARLGGLHAPEETQTDDAVAGTERETSG